MFCHWFCLPSPFAESQAANLCVTVHVFTSLHSFYFILNELADYLVVAQSTVYIVLVRHLSAMQRMILFISICLYWEYQPCNCDEQFWAMWKIFRVRQKLILIFGKRGWLIWLCDDASNEDKKQKWHRCDGAKNRRLCDGAKLKPNHCNVMHQKPMHIRNSTTFMF